MICLVSIPEDASTAARFQFKSAYYKRRSILNVKLILVKLALTVEAGINYDKSALLLASTFLCISYAELILIVGVGNKAGSKSFCSN